MGTVGAWSDQREVFRPAQEFAGAVFVSSLMLSFHLFLIVNFINSMWPVRREKVRRLKSSNGSNCQVEILPWILPNTVVVTSMIVMMINSFAWTLSAIVLEATHDREPRS